VYVADKNTTTVAMSAIISDLNWLESPGMVGLEELKEGTCVRRLFGRNSESLQSEIE
jgi:hypothetical protein